MNEGPLGPPPVGADGRTLMPRPVDREAARMRELAETLEQARELVCRMRFRAWRQRKAWLLVAAAASVELAAAVWLAASALR